MKPSSSLSLELRIINFQLMREKISSTSTRISTPLLCDDYKKIVEITLKFLGSELPAKKKFAWKKVRFMAWSLCSMKAFAFSSEMDCSIARKSSRSCSASLCSMSPSTFLNF